MPIDQMHYTGQVKTLTSWLALDEKSEDYQTHSIFPFLDFE